MKTKKPVQKVLDRLFDYSSTTFVLITIFATKSKTIKQNENHCSCYYNYFICHPHPSIEYGYDACDNRISRQIVLPNTNKNLSITEQKDTYLAL